MSDLVKRKDIKSLEFLDGVKKRAIELRYRGYSYPRMMEVLKDENYEVPPIETLYSWFHKEGYLIKEYEAYKLTENEFRKEEAHLVFKRHVADAAKTLVKKLGSRNERVAIEAAKEILNRELGKPTENIKTEFTGKIAFLDLMKEVENERRETKIIDVPEEDTE